MRWYRFILTDPAAEEGQLTEKFLDVMLQHESGDPRSSLWLQKKSNPKEGVVYLLRTDNAQFQGLIDDYGGEECADPDPAVVSPIAGAAKQ